MGTSDHRDHRVLHLRFHRAGRRPLTSGIHCRIHPRARCQRVHDWICHQYCSGANPRPHGNYGFRVRDAYVLAIANNSSAFMIKYSCCNVPRHHQQFERTRAHYEGRRVWPQLVYSLSTPSGSSSTNWRNGTHAEVSESISLR